MIMAKRMSRVMIIALMLFAIISSSIPTFADDTDTNGTDVNSIDIGYGLGKNGVSQNGKKANYSENGELTGALTTVGTKILGQYKMAITGVAAVLALTFVLLLLVNLAKLGKSAGNPQMRSQAITAIIWTGIAAACTGGVGIFFGFFYNIGQDLRG